MQCLQHGLQCSTGFLCLIPRDSRHRITPRGHQMSQCRLHTLGYSFCTTVYTTVYNVKNFQCVDAAPRHFSHTLGEFPEYLIHPPAVNLTSLRQVPGQTFAAVVWADSTDYGEFLQTVEESTL